MIIVEAVPSGAVFTIDYQRQFQAQQRVWRGCALSIADRRREPTNMELICIYMDQHENYWKLGEMANLPRQEKVKKGGSTSYVNYIASRYICVREATDGRRGILMKVLGKAYCDQVKMVGGEPFGRDEHEELFAGQRYYSYPFPTANEVQEVLEILRANPTLLQKFEDARMHVNPDGMFWVRETARNAFLIKIPQVYSGRDNQIHNISDDTNYYRITMVYFYKGQLNW